MFILGYFLTFAATVELSTINSEEKINVCHASCHIYRSRLLKVLNACGDLCRNDKKLVRRGRKLEFYEKIIQCKKLYESADIDRPGEVVPPIQQIPNCLKNDFLYEGEVPLTYEYHNDRATPTKKHESITVTLDQILQNLKAINEMKTSKKIPGELQNLFSAISRSDVRGQRVLIVGSQSPLLESIFIDFGARDIVSLNENNVSIDFPSVNVMTSRQLSDQFLSGKLELFDTIALLVPIESAGLGRYGDAINPWRDRIEVARAWCLTKPSGSLYLNLTSGDPDHRNNERVIFNSHRNYGQIQFFHLTANWDFDFSVDNNMFVLKKVDFGPYQELVESHPNLMNNLSCFPSQSDQQFLIEKSEEQLFMNISLYISLMPVAIILVFLFYKAMQRNSFIRKWIKR